MIRSAPFRRAPLALILMLSALAGMLLALSLPAHAADVVPTKRAPDVLPMSVLVLLAVVAGGCAGYLFSGAAKTRRLATTLVAIGLGAAVLCLPILALAQESAAPVPSSMPAFTTWLLSPLGRLLCAGVVMAALEALKQWRAFADAALSHPLARAGMALVLAVVAAVPVWATGSSLTEALTMVLSSWLGAMGINGFAGAATKKAPPP